MICVAAGVGVSPRSPRPPRIAISRRRPNRVELRKLRFTPGRGRFRSLDPCEDTMADEENITQSDIQRDKREQRAMWIFSAIIVLLILGGMGANMLFHKDQ